MQAIGIDGPTIRILRSLFDHNSAQLALANCRSALSLQAGVLQGSVLSPLLYSVYLDPLVDKLKSEGPLIPFRTSMVVLIACFMQMILYSSPSRAGNLSVSLRSPRKIPLRGYNFSVTKSVVVSPGRLKHKIYGQQLSQRTPSRTSDSRLAVRVWRSKPTSSGALKRLKRQAKPGRLSGARPGNLPARAVVQLAAKSVIRPSLEYGLPLLADHPGAVGPWTNAKGRS